MKEIRFSWDEGKNRANIKKHGIGFQEAQTVFRDPNARQFHDPDYSEDDDRFILLGFSARLNVLVVCHCYRSKESEIRIISARRADRKERDAYRR